MAYHKGLQCFHGQNCWYRHDRFGEMKEVCWKWENGRYCRFGKKCKYWHKAREEVTEIKEKFGKQYTKGITVYGTTNWRKGYWEYEKEGKPGMRKNTAKEVESEAPNKVFLEKNLKTQIKVVIEALEGLMGGLRN